MSRSKSDSASPAPAPSEEEVAAELARSEAHRKAGWDARSDLALAVITARRDTYRQDGDASRSTALDALLVELGLEGGPS